MKAIKVIAALAVIGLLAVSVLGYETFETKPNSIAKSTALTFPSFPAGYVPECPWFYVNSPEPGIITLNPNRNLSSYLTLDNPTVETQHSGLLNWTAWLTNPMTFHFTNKIRDYPNGYGGIFEEASDGLVRNGQFANGTYWYTVSYCPPGVTNNER